MSGKKDNIVDLSELENFSFQPKWEKQKIEDLLHPYAQENKRSFHKPKYAGNGVEFRKNPWQPRTEGRNFFQKKTRFQRPNGPDRDGHSKDRGLLKTQSFYRRFEPIVDVEFYPNDAVFDAIVSALKSTHKTYELFSVARLFLEKPERFAMVVKKKDTQEDKRLYQTTYDNFIFETESAAIDHILENCVEKYFDVEEREVPPPVGKFICLHKCGMTGKILCPPNYHKYQEILLDHHDRFLSRVPFEKFKARIEKVTAPEEIEIWKTESSKIRIFIPRGQEESVEKMELKSAGEVKNYFVKHLKNKLVIPYNSVRVSGETVSRMPKSLLNKSMFVLIRKEKFFPLGLSNNLRGRLRRSGFTIYKIGNKPGISYTSGIKRKFRTADDFFADNIQKMIAIIDANPKISITSLYLQHTQGDSGIPTDGFNGTDVQALASVSQEFSASTENATVPTLTTSEGSMDREFFKNLHWLIREGYVAEFEDGTLVSTEIIERHKQPVAKVGIDEEVVVESTNVSVENEVESGQSD
ncbi:MAG: hypothetical protein LBB16_03995 [Puniceicoccales bacterium]|jgi:hypothetical protein|nr:hypothetical protein [Puniceicoccales bacterium]